MEATDGIPMAGFTPPKRRRVGLACDRCRAMKHKCDGNQPLCARCRGYGYSCTWNGGRRRAWRDNGLSGGDSVVPAGQHEALRAYDSLVLSIREKVPEADRPDVDARLQYARTLAISDPSRPSTVSDQQQTPQETKVKDEPSIQTPPDQREVGQLRNRGELRRRYCLACSTGSAQPGDVGSLYPSLLLLNPRGISLHLSAEFPSRIREILGFRAVGRRVSGMACYAFYDIRHRVLLRPCLVTRKIDLERSRPLFLAGSCNFSAPAQRKV